MPVKKLAGKCQKRDLVYFNMADNRGVYCKSGGYSNRGDAYRNFGNRSRSTSEGKMFQKWTIRKIGGEIFHVNTVITVTCVIFIDLSL